LKPLQTSYQGQCPPPFTFLAAMLVYE